MRNAQLDPASYYRVIQYVEEMAGCGKCGIHSAMSDWEFQKNINMREGSLKRLFQGYLWLMIIYRRFIALWEDIFIHRPNVVVIQRELVPHILPSIFLWLVRLLGKHSEIIWDFDDDIFISGEISHRECQMLLKNSQKIKAQTNTMKTKN